MRCRLSLTSSSDRLFAISWLPFLDVVEPLDLACRDQATVEDKYLADWFGRDASGMPTFTPPAFYLHKGYALFINGRHRALVLSRHLAIVPMALTQMDPASEEALTRIALRPLEETEAIDLPDLPILPKLPTVSERTS